jgi:hypothetical protein
MWFIIVYDLFYGAVSSLASIGGRLVNNELERVWKEAIVA